MLEMTTRTYIVLLHHLLKAKKEYKRLQKHEIQYMFIRKY